MKHEVRGSRCAPQDIDFIILRGGVSSDTRTVPRKRLVHVKMDGNGRRFVFEIIAGVNVVEGRLQESPQESDQTEDDSTAPHSH